MSARAEPPAAGPGADGEVARSAGRGGLAVAFAKVYFIVVGLVQQIALKRVLGLDGYGALSSALSIASITYNPIVSTSIQGVSRAVAQASEAERAAAVRRTFMVHALLSVLVAAGFFVLSPLIGRWVGAPHIVPALRLLSAVMLLYGLYSPLIGVLNGKKKFVHQAGLDMLAATLRTVGLIGGAWWLARTAGRGVEGATLGFVAGATLILIAAVALVGVGKAGTGGPSVREHLRFIVPLLLGQTLLNLLFQADLTLLRAFAAESAERAGLALEAADPLVGAYRATQLFCFLPYQLLLSVTFILFPLLATAHHDGDRAAVARYVKMGVRLALLVAGLMVSVTSGLAGPLLRLVFGADAAALGTDAMQLLALGFGAFAIFGILITVLNSLKRERVSAVITALAFALVVVLCFVGARGTEFGKALLWRTALATSTGLALATLAAAVFVRREAGAVAPPASVLRVIAASGLAIALGRVLPISGKLATIGGAAVVATAYVIALLVSRELGRTDLELVRTVLSRRRRRE